MKLLSALFALVLFVGIGVAQAGECCKAKAACCNPPQECCKK